MATIATTVTATAAWETARPVGLIETERLRPQLKLGARFSQMGNVPREDHNPAQTVTPAENAEQLISQGWIFVGVLPNNKVVLQRGIRNSSEAGPVGPVLCTCIHFGL
jgi:hypothetical protein